MPSPGFHPIDVVAGLAGLDCQHVSDNLLCRWEPLLVQLRLTAQRLPAAVDPLFQPDNMAGGVASPFRRP